MRNVVRILTGAALMAIAISAFAQGEGPPGNLTQREQVQWLIEEIGYSEDGMTVRESIEATDSFLYALVETITEIYEEDPSARLTQEELAELRRNLQQPANEEDLDRILVRYILIPAMFVIIGILFWLAVQVRTQAGAGDR